MAARLRGMVAPGTPVIELGQAIDLEQFQPAPRDYSARPLRVVQVSRLVHAKGIFTANQAAKLAHESAQTFRVVGWEARRSPHLVAACPSLVFTGGTTLSGVVAELQQADVFVLPTIADSMPRAVLEAMACGLPVITTESSSYGHVIQHGENGFIVPEEDPGAIAAIIARLAEDGGLRERVGRAARATAEAHTWDAFEARFARALHGQLLPSLSPAV
jgi:glycosyltransferase involved in cell wall biosynthesis